MIAYACVVCVYAADIYRYMYKCMYRRIFGDMLRGGGAIKNNTIKLYIHTHT